MKPFIYIFFLILSLNITAGISNNFETISNEISNVSFNNSAKAKELVAALYAIAKRNPQDKKLMPLCMYWESFMYYHQGIDVENIKIRIKTQLKFYTPDSSPFEYALLLHSIAMNDVIKGNYTDGLTNSLHALTIYKQQNNELFSARVLQLLGVICHRTRNFEMSESFLKESIGKKTPLNEYYKSLINMYGAQIFIKGKLEKGLKGMENLIPKIKEYKNPGLEAVLYLNLGASYFYNNQPEMAYPYYKKALEINKHLKNESFTVSILLNTVNYFIYKKQYDIAKRYIEQAETISLRDNNAEHLSFIYYLTSNVYAQQGNIDKAYFYLKKYNSYKDAILNSSKTIDSYQAYVSTYLKSAEKEVNITKQKAQMEKRRLTFYLAFAVFIVLLVIALLIILQQKKRQQSIIKEAEKQTLEKQLLFEKTIQQISDEKHLEVIAAKEREVTSYSLMLSDKNNILHEVLEKAKQLEKVIGKEDKAAYKIITDTINNNLNKDVEGYKFIYHFNEVHPDFFNKLKAVCADLTENNLRICAYFKMGMSNKQVAAILNISVETVKNGRYRLKKKLGLGEGDNLDNFIRNI